MDQSNHQKNIREAQDVLGISSNEVAGMLGVDPPELAKWMDSGVPEKDQADVDRLRCLVELLSREIDQSRLPDVVRRRDVWLGNRTMLEVIKRDGIAPMRQYLTLVFAFRE